MVVSTLALGSSLTTALHTICFARSAYLMNKQRYVNASLSLNFIKLHIEQLPLMSKHPENIHRHRSTTGKIQGGVNNVGLLQETI